MSSGIKVIFGSAGLQPGSDVEQNIASAFDLLEKAGVKNIDTANYYGKSEEVLGQYGASDRFTIDTKTSGGLRGDGGASKEAVKSETDNSKNLLKSNVDILYIHAPDKKTPYEETAAAVNEVYKAGFFKRFGLSNFYAEDVERMYNVCKEKGYVLPSVYQGNYSAVARKQEEVLFPTLRKLNIAFYAYSPLAGGFLTKTKQQIKEGAGRFNTGGMISDMYTGLYGKDSYLDALAQWEAIAKDEGVTRADLAYRWVRYHSPLKNENGDGIIIGARTNDQLEETLKSINGGPLSDKAVQVIQQVWETIKHDAPLDNVNG